MTYIIRTSDRGNFKRCRQQWDFSSKMRQDYEPIVNAPYFDFGSAFHAAMQTYYDPKRWTEDREIVALEALAAFHSLCAEQKKQVLTIRSGGLAIEVEQDFNERRTLGEGMLKHYFKWAPNNDRFTPVKAEIEFEVPIPVYHDGVRPWPIGFASNLGGNLTFHGHLVVYQGRLDLIVVDAFGDFWIIDHKTAAALKDISWLTLDDQVTSYCWAMQQLGVKTRGFLYSETAKRFPDEPIVLKNGELSRNKQQDTTYEVYLAALQKGGYDLTAYGDFLEYLKDNPKQFIRRTPIYRSEKELEAQGRRIFLEAIDMLNDPSIYPNPSAWNCNGCFYRQPCTATQDGSDVQFLLDNLYKKRGSN